jgi:kynurenine formamidase
VKQKGAVFVASDTLVLEHPPEEPGQGADPVHVFPLVEQGVHIGERFWLEDLAKDRTHEFLFIVTPLKLKGGTGSMVRPIAIS